jgi:O-methyltransferase involved in polyketide biosynthesis
VWRMASSDPSRISPTAHYTSDVWVRNGMSHPVLGSLTGRFLHAVLAPANLAALHIGGRPNLDQSLLARHRILDHLLETAIAAGRVRQVVEVAAGLSPRGFRFAQRHPEIRYIEGDLPESAARKRRLLDAAGLRGPNHEVTIVDALRDDGEGSLAALAATLERGAGTAIITEGLLGYFDLPTVEGMWRRFAGALRGLGGGVYLADLNIGGDATVAAKLFRRALSWFARGEVYLHFGGPAQAEGAALAAGFDEAHVRKPADFPDVDVPRRDAAPVVRLLDAWVRG